MTARCNVAFLGFGAVAAAAARLLETRRRRYLDLYDRDVRIVGIRRSRAEVLAPEGLDVAALDDADARWRPPSADFYEAPFLDVLVDASPSDPRTGGAGLPAMEAMLARGRHVVAASKGAIVHSGPALLAMAARTGAMLEVSAAAGAALPALDILRHGVRGCEVLKVEGILNATTNHLLGRMSSEGVSLEAALARARSEGTMEADPRADIEGWDTASKLVILALFGLGTALAIDDIDVGGMQGVTVSDIRAMKARGEVAKLVGTLRRSSSGYEAAVALRALPATDPLAGVGGSDKAVRVTTDAMGEIFVSVAGPEPLSTAAAALKDLEKVMQTMTGR